MEACTCGRVYTHCRQCGNRSVYAKKFRTMEVSIALNRQVTVYGCRKCAAETNESEPCTAPSIMAMGTDYKPYQPPPAPEKEKPYGSLIVDTPEYGAALQEAVRDIQSKKMISVKD